MNNLWALLPMRDSSPLLGDPPALRRRLDEDGYLWLRRVLDPQRLTTLREHFLKVLARHRWVRPDLRPQAVTMRRLTWEGEEDIQRLQAFHELAHDETLLEIGSALRGGSVFPHPLKIARLGFPGSDEVSTAPHQDFPNNQGTPHLLATWIPLGDCPADLGGLAILRGSHRYGVLPLAYHMGPGRRQAVIPMEMREALRWVTTDFAMGDVLLFPALTVHAALHNTSEFEMRLSVDFRYQRDGEALTEPCLKPHFQRLAWEEIYAGWSSSRHQYYWRARDYRVVPFEDMGPTADPDATLSDKDWRQILDFEWKRDARHVRRQAAVRARFGPEPPSEGEAGR